MTDMTRLTPLFKELAAASTPEERAAVRAELAFTALDEYTELIARRCAALHWFDLAVVGALSVDSLTVRPLSWLPGRRKVEQWLATKIWNQLARLHFVERKAFGLAYQQDTRTGLLARYVQNDPDLLRQAAALAEPAYARHPDPTVGLPEAVYCRAVAGDEAETLTVLMDALMVLGDQQAWSAVLAVFSRAEEGRQLIGSPPLALTGIYYAARGFATQESGDLTGALTDYDRALALQPNDATTYYNRGNARNAQGDFTGALADYDRALTLQPDDANAYSNRGVTRSDLGDLAGAITDYDRALALQPDDATTYNSRGNAHYALGDLTRAIADYDRAIALEPDNAARYYNRGNVRRTQGDLTGAVADFDQAIALRSDDADAYNSRGNARSSLGDLTGAIVDYDRAITLKPDGVSAHFNRGLVRYALGDLTGAVADHDQAIALQPDLVQAYYSRGNARSALGDFTGAMNDYDQAVALEPDYLNAYSALGTTLRLLGRLEEAAAAYRSALELDPDRAGDWLALADIHRRRGETAAWQAGVAQARPLVPPDNLYNNACLESIAGEVDLALDLLARALAATPHDATQARQDPDLAWLHDDPRFQALVGRAAPPADAAA